MMWDAEYREDEFEQDDDYNNDGDEYRELEVDENGRIRHDDILDDDDEESEYYDERSLHILDEDDDNEE